MALDVDALIRELTGGMGTSTAVTAAQRQAATARTARMGRQRQLGEMIALLGQGRSAAAPPAGQSGYQGMYHPAGGNPAGQGLTTIIAPNGQRVTVAANYAGKFSGLLRDLWNAGYRFKDVQGYSYRNIAGTNRLSKHATGEAIDIDPQPNRGTRLGGGGNPTGYFDPGVVTAIIRRYGLDWGGLWKGEYDPMHFSTGG